MDSRTIDRREFTLQTAIAILSAATITITGCGGGDSGPGPSPNPNPNPNPGPTDVTGSVSANHGHSAVVTSAQITAANAIQLSITGTADHPHTIELTAGEVMQIGARQRVSKNSTTDASHQHTVTFN
jgi:hypothetical protein